MLLLTVYKQTELPIFRSINYFNYLFIHNCTKDYNFPNIAFIIFFRKLTETTDKQKEYSNILFSLLSFKSEDVVLHTYLALNNTLKKIFNHLNFELNKIDRLINNLLCTNVLNEIICFGCNNTNEKVCYFYIFFIVLTFDY